MDVSGKGVVVTGAGRGIGRAIAARMAAEGARVVVNDLDSEAVRSVAADIEGQAVPGDAASEHVVHALIGAAREHLGAIDIYFANAGIVNGRGLDTSQADWAKAIDVNVMAHVRAAQWLVPAWLDSGGGRFVVTASAAGLLTARQRPVLGDQACGRRLGGVALGDLRQPWHHRPVHLSARRPNADARQHRANAGDPQP